MQQVRDISKKTEKYLIQLEQNNFEVVSLQSHQAVVSSVKECSQECDNCIDLLIKDGGQGSHKIANS